MDTRPISRCPDDVPGEVLAHALRCWPEECCGIVYASGRVRRGINVHPRPREAFLLDAAATISLYESFRSSDPAVVIYHSHPNGTSQWSSVDEEGTAVVGRSVFSSLRYLVIACSSERILAVTEHNGLAASPPSNQRPA